MYSPSKIAAAKKRAQSAQNAHDRRKKNRAIVVINADTAKKTAATKSKMAAVSLMTVKQLRDVAARCDVRGASTMKKAELVEVVRRKCRDVL